MHKGLVSGLLLVMAMVAARAMAEDWPQLQHDARHTGYSSEIISLLSQSPEAKPATPMVRGWMMDFTKLDPPEHIYSTVQVIASEGKLLVPTMEGNLYALAPKNGQPIWKFAGGELVNQTAAADKGKAFFATMQGSVYAVDLATGKQVWKWSNGRRTGFSTAVVLDEGRLYVAGRGGDVHALDPGTGKALWSITLEAPILQTPACQGGRVYLAAEDMVLYCLSAEDGRVLWKSRTLSGQSFRDYYPVIHDGKVIVESEPGRNMASGLTAPFTVGMGTLGDGMPPLIWGTSKEFLEKYGQGIAAGKPAEEAVQQMIACQDLQVEALKKHPERMLRFCFDAADGKEHILPLWMITMNGPQPPPIVDRDGMLVMPVGFIQMTWGRMDPKRERVVDVLYDPGTGQDPSGYNDRGRGNPDEDMVLSACGNLILATHTWGVHHAQYTGYFNLDSRRWNAYGPWDKTVRNPKPVRTQDSLPPNQRNIGPYHNAQNEAAAPSIAYGGAYFQTRSVVIAWVPRPQ